MSTKNSESSYSPKKAENENEEKNKDFATDAPPLSSSSEPTRAYPSDPSRTYSSDPSQYAYPHTETTQATRDPRNIDSDSNAGQNVNKESFQEKARDSFRSFRESKKIDEMYHYAANNKEQTYTYISLFFGFLLLFFHPLTGGLIIGMVGGYHFAPEISRHVHQLKRIFSSENRFLTILFNLILLGLFIAAPGFFIGALIMTLFLHFGKNE